MYAKYWYDGHSGGVTPGPIPNPAVKSARVSVCTVVRKSTGTQTRCQPLFSHYKGGREPLNPFCSDKQLYSSR